MKRIVLALSACMFAVIACGVPSLRIVQGSGNIITRTYEVESFDRVQLNTIGDLHIAQGSVESLSIETDDNIIPLLTVDIRGGALVLGDKSTMDLQPTSGVTFRLTVKDLSALVVTSSGRILMDTLEAPNMELRLDGSGGIDIGSLKTGILSVTCTGSGDISVGDILASRVDAELDSSGAIALAGGTDTQTVDVSGSGTVQAADLISQEATVHLSSSGAAIVHAVEKLDVSVDGSGSVSYYGTPALTQSITGSGTLTALGAK